jgi:hypothetical protein
MPGYTYAPLRDRQRLIVNRLLDGFEGKLTSSASRDIDELVARGILAKDQAGGG